MSIVLDGSQGISTPMYAGSITSNPVTPSVNMKSRIINGGMVIDQRNAGASVTANDGVFGVDRFKTFASQSSKLNVQQNAGSVTPPAGFSNYLGYTSTSAYSLGSSDYFQISHAIEGFNIADLAWGTANAKTVTLSFWVRSSLTGTFAGLLLSSTASHSYPFTYTISAANTWEQKTITISGSQVATWNTTNGTGLVIRWGLGIGSSLTGGTNNTWNSGTAWSSAGTSVVGTNGATFYITGVQLEVGSTATSFDYRQYGTELALCQRYFEMSFNQGTAPADNVNAGNDGVTAAAYSASNARVNTKFAVTKRATPTVVTYKGSNSGTNGQWSYYNGSAWVTFGASNINASQTQYYNELAPSGRSFGQALIVDGNWTASAEL